MGFTKDLFCTETLGSEFTNIFLHFHYLEKELTFLPDAQKKIELTYSRASVTLMYTNNR